jgi:hypothetical protein
MISSYGVLRSCAVLVGAATQLHGQTAPYGLASVTWATGADSGRIDRGIGIAYLAKSPGRPEVMADTVWLRAYPDSAAKVVGAFLYEHTRVGIAWRNGVASTKRLRPNVLEFAYEEAGVPIDSLAAGNGWARMILGFDRHDAPYRGWAALDSTRLK